MRLTELGVPESAQCSPAGIYRQALQADGGASLPATLVHGGTSVVTDDVVLAHSL